MILWTYNFNKIYEEQRDLEQLSGLGDFSFVAWSQIQTQGLEAKHKYYSLFYQLDLSEKARTVSKENYCRSSGCWADIGTAGRI